MWTRAGTTTADLPGSCRRDLGHPTTVPRPVRQAGSWRDAIPLLFMVLDAVILARIWHGDGVWLTAALVWGVAALAALIATVVRARRARRAWRARGGLGG